MLWNFCILTLVEPYEVTCQVGEGGMGSTLLIHLPAVNLEHYNELPESTGGNAFSPDILFIFSLNFSQKRNKCGHFV